MPGDMRLLTRLEGPSLEETPPSTRPPSSASSNSSSSTSGPPPHRSTSMDSINHPEREKPAGVENIPTRNTRIEPKCNVNASKFIKTGPANLHMTAKQQLEKVAAIKAIRKPSLMEEEEWQSTRKPSVEDAQDWQANLDKWKSCRRKMNEDAIERVIRVKESEQLIANPPRRKSMTLRGRITTHDDDNNDISDLLSPSIEVPPPLPPPLNHHQREDSDIKYVDSDAKDTKSDPGFCTGSDTGSDGVFAEDSISDTSSALGDKKEAPDSLLDPPSREGELYDSSYSNSHTREISSPTNAYDKAIEDYKQFAENSAKKRTSSIHLDDEKQTDKYSNDKNSPSVSAKITDKLDFFHTEIEKETSGIHPKSATRRRTPQIELDKRRSMFELRDIDKISKKPLNRRSFDATASLKSKVASFESIPGSDNKPKGITPPRDLKFREKLATFNTSINTDYSVVSRRALTSRDKNFDEKLKNFADLERGESKSLERRLPNIPASFHLKERIASFEGQGEHSLKDKSLSMDCLSSSTKKQSSSPFSNVSYMKRAPSTPYMVVELDSAEEEEKACVRENISRERLYTSSTSQDKNTLDLERASFAPIRGSSLERRADLTAENNRKQPSSTIMTSPSSTIMTSPSSTIMTSPSSTIMTSPSSTIMTSPSSTIMTSPSPTIMTSPPSTLVRPFTSSSSAIGGGTSVVYKRPINDNVCPTDKVPKTPTPSSMKPIELVPKTDELHPNTVEFVPKVVEHPPIFSKLKIEQPSATYDSNALPRYSGLMKPNSPPPPPPTSPPPEIPPFEPLVRKEVPETPSATAISETITFSDAPQNSFEEKIVEEDSNFEYGDDDINEVIQDYEYLSPTPQANPEPHLYEKASEMTTPGPSENLTENYYENILEDEPVYENIYEKVEEDDYDSSSQTMEYSGVQHHYQTLEEVKADVVPPLPPKSKNFPNVEVIDVTWTEEDIAGGPRVAPPTVPPPPPPPEADLEEDGESKIKPGSPSLIEPTFSQSMSESHLSSSNIKKELRKKRSDFLGTSPLEEEEISIQPPIDVNELLRQERQSERLILQKQAANLSIPNFELEPHRSRYTWDDRMRDDGSRPKDLNESTDHFEFHSKLEELEREMVKHDLDMMHRVSSSKSSIVNNNNSELYANVQEHKASTQDYSEDTQLVSHDGAPTKAAIAPSLPIQEFYTAPSFNEAPPLTRYNMQTTQAEATPTPSSAVSFATYTDPSPKYEQPPPELVPRKKKMPIMVPQENQIPPPSKMSEPVDYNHRNEIRSSNSSMDSGASSPSGQPLSKQSIMALSAIPKPRLTDNDSWIMKRKPDAAAKRDYGKHWLIQEAEQRRIEQQDRMAMQKTIPSTVLAKSPTSPPNTGYHSHYQNLRSSFDNPPTYPPPSHPPAAPTSSNPLPQNFQPSVPTPLSHSSSSNLLNNNWKKQTKTYQQPTTTTATTYQPPQEVVNPPQPKPLPDAIINTLTQRVTSKTKNSVVRTNGSLNSNYRNEDYHDYMNMSNEGLNSNPQSSSYSFAPHNNYGGPLAQQVLSNGGPSHTQTVGPYQQPNLAQPPPHAPPPPAPANHNHSEATNSTEEQRLLSVSGKKKCSHCGEELGRGAAMIIESLRLFYHIPCFKCCVCSIQLGNGTSGADVRVRNHKLHCHNCYSNDEGMKFSKV